MLETFQKSQINEIQTVFVVFFKSKRGWGWACGGLKNSVENFRRAAQFGATPDSVKVIGWLSGREGRLASVGTGGVYLVG